MSAYRFCRTDDIGLLVDALNRCWLPHFPGEGAITPAAFKRSIRDLQVWCSSCMVAFSGSDPIGVLIGAKRSSSTLVHTIAVHPEHRRQGHGRHLLASLGSKLAILGPPRIVAEVPEALAPACELFRSGGYVEEALLTDYVLQCEGNDAGLVVGPESRIPSPESRIPSPESPVPSPEPRVPSPEPRVPSPEPRVPSPESRVPSFVIPVTVDDLAANGLLEGAPPPPLVSAGHVHPPVCWERSVETLTARKGDIAGLAVASDEQIEAYLLYVTCGMGETEIVSLCSLVDDGGARLKKLISHLRAQGMRSFRLPKVHPAEISEEWLETLGFHAVAAHRLYATLARSG